MPHSTNLTFRPATVDDIDVNGILKLVRSAYRGDESRAGWTTEADLLDDERIDAAGVRAKIEAPDSTIILAHDDEGKLVSCCEVVSKEGGKLGYFGLFSVDPRRQSGGIGSRLLAEAEDYARRTFGATRMEMTVIWLRSDIIAWYIRKGYVKTDETRPFPFHELINGKALRDDLHFVVLVKDL
ncbi:Ribosomal protein S18 acetylase RimI [Geosmithia morbida]|uniref:Ribosomal protein S18 acetylase RimI n=1 Tax=Geosmithia morbida TaxID=1094350 RepID=A0A9P5D2F9_9HYPO|nr:Ribosomal protein S18 acetylase RimI [Geosmithia morbida]KAF4121441.1 Ribosomal protein S18 acetylase RimI [Geosmithia morbida]